MKRSTQVALLLMGVTGAGAGAYALTPPRQCVADQPGAVTNQVAPGAITPGTLAPGARSVVTPGLAPQAAANPCPPRRRWDSSGTSRSHWYIRDTSSSTSNQPTRRSVLFSPSRSHTSVPSVGSRSGSTSSPRSSIPSGGSGMRGGFGSSGHSASAHSSGS